MAVVVFVERRDRVALETETSYNYRQHGEKRVLNLQKFFSLSETDFKELHYIPA